MFKVYCVKDLRFHIENWANRYQRVVFNVHGLPLLPIAYCLKLMTFTLDLRFRLENLDIRFLNLEFKI